LPAFVFHFSDSCGKGTLALEAADPKMRATQPGYRNNQTAVPIAAQKSKAAKTTMTMAESTPYTVLDRAMGGTESEYSVMQIILPRTIASN
jgi:hypothetical protein